MSKSSLSEPHELESDFSNKRGKRVTLSEACQLAQRIRVDAEETIRRDQMREAERVQFVWEDVD